MTDHLLLQLQQRVWYINLRRNIQQCWHSLTSLTFQRDLPGWSC